MDFNWQGSTIVPNGNNISFSETYRVLSVPNCSISLAQCKGAFHNCAMRVRPRPASLPNSTVSHRQLRMTLGEDWLDWFHTSGLLGLESLNPVAHFYLFTSTRISVIVGSRSLLSAAFTRISSKILTRPGEYVHVVGSILSNSLLYNQVF